MIRNSSSISIVIERRKMFDKQDQFDVESTDYNLQLAQSMINIHRDDEIKDITNIL